jgi:hypothetical protein
MVEETFLERKKILEGLGGELDLDRRARQLRFWHLPIPRRVLFLPECFLSSWLIVPKC